MREILLATGNPDKAKEMQEILGAVRLHEHSAGEALTGKMPVPHGSTGEMPLLPGPIRWRMLSEFPDWPTPVEDGDTFMANAILKAQHYARLSGLWTVADDSGLEVDALGGAPGVYSARYAGEPSNSLANNAMLIANLAGVPVERRTARFRCAVALSDGRQVLASAEGAVEGRIVDQPLGTNGFGYDPHFWVDAFGMTTAQMPSEQKHAISHRGQALRHLAEQLPALL